jgi:predicted Zn-dependent protease
MKKYTGFIYAASALFLIQSCATNPVTGRREVALVSEGQELNMGKEADPQIVAQYGLYPDKGLQDFISQKGKEMVAVSHRPNIAYEFKIVDSDVLNAFAIPGYVYFTRGIMAHFNNEQSLPVCWDTRSATSLHVIPYRNKVKRFLVRLV